MLPRVLFPSFIHGRKVLQSTIIINESEQRIMGERRDEGGLTMSNIVYVYDLPVQGAVGRRTMSSLRPD